MKCGFVIGHFPPLSMLSQYGHINVENYMGSLGMMRKDDAVFHVDLVLQSGPPVLKWLDVGCGIASVLAEAKKRGFAVFGVEPDPIAKKLAIEATGAAIIDEFTNDALPDESQGVISMLDFLEHIEPPNLMNVAFIVRKKLADEGLWLIKVPSSDGLFYLLASFVARWAPFLVVDVIKRLWMFEYKFPHRVYFSEYSLSAFLRRNGFIIEGIHYTAAMPTGTILKRLQMNSTLSSYKVLLLAPLAVIINLVEKLRRRSDSLVILARKPGSTPRST